MGRLNKLHNGIDTVAGHLSAIIIILLMVTTGADSIARSIFNRPFVGLFEISEFAMAWIGFLSVAYTQLLRGHITMNLIKGLFPPKVQALLDFFIMGLSLVIVIFLGWVGLRDAMECIEFQEKITSGLISIQIGPPKLIFPFGCLLLALRFISQMVNDLKSLYGKKVENPMENAEDEIKGETI